MWSHPTPPRLAGHSYRTPQSFFVTFCVRFRTPVFAEPAAAEIAKSAILRCRERGYFWLQAYCIMPDHIHLLVVPRSTSRHLSRVVATVKNAILNDLRRNGKSVCWQWGYHDRVLRRDEAVGEVAAYILMNPVRKQLVADYREWPFSGIVDRWF